jgi:hypothetical protein
MLFKAPDYRMDILRHASDQRLGVRIETRQISRSRESERKFNILSKYICTILNSNATICTIHSASHGSDISGAALGGGAQAIPSPIPFLGGIVPSSPLSSLL